MARLPRLSLAGELHFVILRGLDGVALFHDDIDRRAFLDMLIDAAGITDTAVHAYRLGANAVHLLVTPPDDEALGRLVQALGRRYVAGHNRRHQRRGTLWDGRYRATVLQGAAHALNAQVLIERPEAGAAGDGAAPWSSAAHHLGRVREPWLKDHAAYWALGNTPFERENAYRQRFDDGLPEATRDRLLTSVLKGWALGDDAFLARLSRATSRPLAPRPRGRPRRQPA